MRPFAERRTLETMQEESFGDRCRAYSAWHRRLSTRRYVGLERAQLLAMIDLDGVLYLEYDDETREPLALIETARDVGQAYKAAGVLTRLAQRSGLPAFVVLYRCSAEANPADPRWPDVDRFRVRRCWPHPEPEWRVLSPLEWTQELLRLRQIGAARLDVEAANDARWDGEPGAGMLTRRA